MLELFTYEEGCRRWHWSSRSGTGWFVSGLQAYAAGNRVAEFAADVASSFHPSGFRAMARASAEADLRDVLPTVDVPTLILHGDVQAFLNQ